MEICLFLLKMKTSNLIIELDFRECLTMEIWVLATIAKKKHLRVVSWLQWLAQHLGDQ
jgi:hypothetical protein